jgi:hypothetical protein
MQAFDASGFSEAARQAMLEIALYLKHGMKEQ